jgi:hypothetical protein
VLLAIILSSCNSPEKSSQPKNRAPICSAKSISQTQVDLADSMVLEHIKGVFYKSKEGHLYERTIAQREMNGSSSLIDVEYFNGVLPQDIDPLTFQQLDGWYAKDKNSAYYYRPTSGGMLTVKLDKADTKSFSIFQGHYQYAVDKNHVFANGEILENIQSEKARIIVDRNRDIISIK